MSTLSIFLVKVWQPYTHPLSLPLIYQGCGGWVGEGGWSQSHLNLGKECGTPWAGGQSISRLAQRETRAPVGNPGRHTWGENAKSREKGPSQPVRSNPGLSCCAPCHPRPATTQTIALDHYSSLIDFTVICKINKPKYATISSREMH